MRIGACAPRPRRTRPYILVGWLWYLITLVPVIGLVQVGMQAMADRYTYVPLTGLFIIIAWGVPDLLALIVKPSGNDARVSRRGLCCGRCNRCRPCRDHIRSGGVLGEQHHPFRAFRGRRQRQLYGSQQPGQEHSKTLGESRKPLLSTEKRCESGPITCIRSSILAPFLFRPGHSRRQYLTL